MRGLTSAALLLFIAAGGGVLSAWLVVERGDVIGASRIGAWTARPGAGTADADPYTAAIVAVRGEVPLGRAEGLAFVAAADDLGDALQGGCRYRVSGRTPPARLWTLAAYDGSGHLAPGPAARSGIHSRGLLRHPDGSFDIEISPTAEPGNWLPVGADGPYRLVLRLYDTPYAAGLQADPVMPAILRVGCG